MLTVKIKKWNTLSQLDCRILWLVISLEGIDRSFWFLKWGNWDSQSHPKGIFRALSDIQDGALCKKALHRRWLTRFWMRLFTQICAKSPEVLTDFFIDSVEVMHIKITKKSTSWALRLWRTLDGLPSRQLLAQS